MGEWFLDDEILKRLNQRIRATRIRLVFVVLFNVIGFVVLYGFYVKTRGIEYANQNTFQDLANFFAIEGFAFFGYLLYVALYEIPAEIDKEKSEKIEKLEQSKSRETSPILTVERYVYPSDKIKKVGITVHNNSPQDLTDISIKLINLTKCERDSRRNLQIEKIPFGRVRREFNLRNNPKVDANDSRSFVLAEIQGKSIVFLVQNSPIFFNEERYKFHKFRGVEYTLYEIEILLEFQIHGMLGNASVKEDYRAKIISTRVVPNRRASQELQRHYDRVQIDISRIRSVERR